MTTIFMVALHISFDNNLGRINFRPITELMEYFKNEVNHTKALCHLER